MFPASRTCFTIHLGHVICILCYFRTVVPVQIINKPHLAHPRSHGRNYSRHPASSMYWGFHTSPFPTYRNTYSSYWCPMPYPYHPNGPLQTLTHQNSTLQESTLQDDPSHSLCNSTHLGHTPMPKSSPEPANSLHLRPNLSISPEHAH